MIVGLVAFADANTHTEVKHARKGLEERPSRVETQGQFDVVRERVCQELAD